MENSAFNRENLFKLNPRLDLDTVATVFPLTFRDKHRSLVRLSVSLNEKVDINNLQLALDNLLPRFPTFYVRLHQDKFKYYLEKLESAPTVYEVEEEQEALKMTIEDLRKCVFKVFTVDNRVIFEYFHAITDGVGGSIFLKTLIIEYLIIRYGVTISSNFDTISSKEDYKYRETIDAFPNIAGASTKKDSSKGTYILKGKVEKIYISEYVFNSKELLVRAKEYGVTITSLLAGILIAAIFDLQIIEGKKLKEIRLSIPIDLRRRFDSETLRNFSLPSVINAGKLNKEMTLSDLCQVLDHELKKSVDKNKLSSHATTYVKLTKNKAITFSPLFMKKWFVRLYLFIFKFGYSMTFSNLGVWPIPDNIKPYIKEFSIAVSPKPTTPYSCGVASVNDTLTITLTRNIKEPLLETRILSILNNVILNDDLKLG